MRYLKILGQWVLPMFLGALFVLIGFGKFGAPRWETDFLRWGYPPGAHVAVGLVEIAAGLGLMVPRFTFWAAALLAAVMLGAAATHLYWSEPSQVARPIGFLALAVLAGYLRRVEPRSSGVTGGQKIRGVGASPPVVPIG